MEEGANESSLNCNVGFPEVNPLWLNAMSNKVSEEEIEKVVRCMGSLKAPGPDGFNALFFQNQWPQVCSSVHNFITKIFDDPRHVQDVNHTFLVLIPKIDFPEKLKDFRPISLCNVIYKIVTKIVVNRIKPILSKVVSPNQCSFVPGRLSSDNIIVAQEVIHSMRNLKGKRGFMAIKIDLEKAYDRVRWSFVLECLRELHLPNMFIELIKWCISSPSMQILWNGSKSEQFNPTRGLRQGDPISPYLFVICMEKLAHLIQEQMNNGSWKPIRLNSNGPPISHLFFADDLVIFAEASLNQVRIIKKCMTAFCSASGQRVNAAKTRVFFSKNVNHNVREELSNALGYTRTADLGKYLGVPIHHEKVNRNTYKYVVDRVRSRLSGWKVHSLSLAGRNTLIKSTVTSIPNHVMQTALLPVSTCDELDRLSRDFLWGSTAENRKAHLVAWEKCVRRNRWAAWGSGIQESKIRLF